MTQPVSSTSTEVTFRYDWKTSWLNGAECAPPCWEGITPGKTTLSEAVELINRMPGVRITSTYQETIFWEQDQSYFGFATISKANNMISTIVMDFDRKQHISIQDAIYVFGEPARVQTFSCSGSLCDVYVIYPEIGLSLRLWLESREYEITIMGSSEIVGVKFFAPGIENYLKEPIFQTSPIREWVGYGTYPE